MAITITINAEHRHDQTSGLQKDDVALSSSLSELPDPFEDFLIALAIPQGLRDNAADYEAAMEVSGAGFYVDVTTDGEQLNDLFFSQSDGTLFDGVAATYDPGTGAVPITDLNGNQVYLYSFAGGDILIGSTQVPLTMDPVAGVDITAPSTLDTSKLVFAYYLQENATHTGADIWGVTFQPIAHGDTGDNDDVIDFAEFLHVSAAASLSFAFDTLESGKFLWVAVGTEDEGLIVTGKSLNVDDTTGERVSGGQNASDAVNTSQGGTGATIGIDNQLFVPGETAVFTLVKGFTPLGSGPDATGNNVTEIDYAGYINTVGAALFISQKQGSPSSKIDLTISVWEAGGGTTPEEGFGYIGAEPSGAFDDDTPIAVKSVTIVNASGVDVATWGAGGLAFGTTHLASGIMVNLLNTMGVANKIDVNGIDALYTVEWTAVDGSTFNRFQMTADAGKFDVGRVDVDEGLVETKLAGDKVFIHDDGPTAAISLTGTVVVHDESPLLQNSGIAAGEEDNDDDDQGGPPPVAITAFEGAEPGLGARLGWAQSDGAVVSTAGTGPGTDGGGSKTLSLELSANGVYSGIDVLSGDQVLLFKEGDLIVGRIDTGDLSPEDNAVAFVIHLDSNGLLSTAQYLALKHLDITDPDDAIGIQKDVLFAKVVQTDADGDSASDMVDLGYDPDTEEPTDAVVQFEDDGPTAGGPALGAIEEDDLDNTQSVGINEDLSVDAHISEVNFGSVLFTTPGVDAPARFALVDPAPGDLPDLTSKGETVEYDIEFNDMGDFYTLTGYVDSGDTADAFDANDRKVFTWVIDGLGMSTYTQIDQVDHDLLPAGENELTIDLTPFLSITDAEGDPVPADVLDGLATYPIIDDIPTIGPIADGLVDFDTTPFPGDATDHNGDSTNSVTKSLDGVIGSDENDSDNETGAGTKTYTFTAASIAAGSPTPIAGLTPQIVDNGTKVVFYVDDDGVAGFSAGDTIFFQNVLGDQGGAGTYTFTVLQDPPPASIEFDFAGTPSGKNLFTIIEDTDADVAVVVTPFQEQIILNTSKGGGPTTLGLGNQMIDQGETMVFTFVKNPADTVTVPQLDQTEADLEDNIVFTGGLVTITGGEVEIVQVQGNAPAALRLTALDTTGTAEAVGNNFINGFGDDDIADITSVTVYDAAGIEVFTWGPGDSGDNRDGVTVTFVTVPGAKGGVVAEITGLQDDYSVEYEAASHQRVTVTGQGGKFDIGGFNISESQPTPDQKFEFTVAITDYDGDTASDTFEVVVDGTGIFDDDAFLVL